MIILIRIEGKIEYFVNFFLQDVWDLTKPLGYEKFGAPRWMKLAT